MANIVTGFRVLVSFALLFCLVFSPVFYAFYLMAGLSDVIDGTIARRTNTVSDTENQGCAKGCSFKYVRLIVSNY